MTIEHWQMEKGLKEELENHYKTAYSLSLANENPLDIMHALTFDHLADDITVEELNGFLNQINTKFLKGSIKGVGLEVGSGPGTFVGAFANIPGVEKVYGVEACAAIIEELMVKVVDHVAKNNSFKVVGAVGDFNNLELPDNSVDFVFDFFSLHHSINPEVTLSEICRVLRPGGVLIFVDKARDNKMSEADLDALLDMEYTPKVKREMGLPEDVRHTRRMNGENEYRLKDWQAFSQRAGFQSFEHYNVAKIGGFAPVRLVKKALSYMPFRFQVRLSKYISKSVTNNLEPSNRIFTNIFPNYPREFSLMVAKK